MSKGKRLTAQEFLIKAKQVHGDKYDYSLVDYKNTKTKVKIKCKNHGVFEQRPHNHLTSKQGCPICKNINTSNRSRSNKDKFIKKAKVVHESIYDYSLVKYITNKIKVKIICPEHGIFEQTPNNHLRFHGCPYCGCLESIRKNKENPMGWKTRDWKRVAKKSNRFDSFKVYIIRCWNEEEEFYKIGKTFSTTKYRFRCKKSMPYNWETLKIFEGTAEDTSSLEKDLQRKNKENKYIPKIKFLGSQECFNKILYVNK